MKPDLPAGLALAMLLGGCVAPAWALCPDKLPVALLEECIVVEGLGQKYPVEEALADWRRRHAERAPQSLPPSAAREPGIASAPRMEKATKATP